MTRMELKSRIGPDGILNLNVPVGLAEANKEVIVTVESITTAPKPDQESWRKAVEATAGSILDPTFVRHEQGDYEARKAWE